MQFDEFMTHIKDEHNRLYSDTNLNFFKVILHCLTRGLTTPSFLMYSTKNRFNNLINEVEQMSTNITNQKALTNYYIVKNNEQITKTDPLSTVEMIFLEKIFDLHKKLLHTDNYHLVFIFSLIDFDFTQFGYALGKTYQKEFIRLLNKHHFDFYRFKDDLMSFNIRHEDLENLREKNNQDLASPINTSNSLKKENLKALSTFCIDLNQKLDPSSIFFGRENEINQMFRVLNKKNKSCPILLGEPGVGKTALVENLVNKIQNKKCPVDFQNTIVFELSLINIMAGTKYRGDIEDRIKNILLDLDKVKKENKVILFIDEIHMIIDQQSNIDIANLLKPLMARGDIKLIGSTTETEWNRTIKNDPAFNRRFNPIWVSEPSIEETKKILLSIKEEYESKHCVQFSEEQISMIVDLTSKFVNDSKRPDNAIDMMDMIGSRAQLEMELIDNVFIAKTISDYKFVPIDIILGRNNKNIKKELNDKVIGQKHVVDKVYKSIIGDIVKTRENNKPIGVYLFSGSTGVGKTELSESIAKILECDLITLNMESYKDISSVNRLIGSPPGYIGHNNESIFSKALRKNGRVLFLLDEVEKAHADVLDIFLNIFDKGFVVDSNGNRLNFNNCFFIMTTNAKPEKVNKNNISLVNTVLKKELTFSQFKPELLGRLSGICHFNDLTKDDLATILEIKIGSFTKNIKERYNFSISFSNDVKDFIVQEAMLQNSGGRGISKVFNDIVKEHIDEFIMQENYKKNEVFLFETSGDSFEIKVMKKKRISNVK